MIGWTEADLRREVVIGTIRRLMVDAQAHGLEEATAYLWQRMRDEIAERTPAAVADRKSVV